MGNAVLADELFSNSSSLLATNQGGALREIREGHGEVTLHSREDSG